MAGFGSRSLCDSIARLEGRFTHEEGYDKVQYGS